MGIPSLKKFLKVVSGSFTEEAAVLNSAGASDANKIPALDNSGRLDATFMPTGIGADTVAMLCIGDLIAGDLVNVYNNSSIVLARKADASSVGKEAIGFVLSPSFSGGLAVVHFNGTNALQTGLTVGTQFLSTVAGKCSDVAPTGAGQVAQIVGVAINSTTLNFYSGTSVTLA